MTVADRVIAYVGLGANLGDPHRQLEAAIGELGRLPGTKLRRQSGIYRTAPVGYADQPDFLNAAVELDTTLAPDALLRHLQEIEDRHGRERPFANAPRTLDLDLLLHGDSVVDTPALTLPHPRMHERAFVLAPLVEIAPGVVVPGHGAARDLLAACRGQKVAALHG